MRVRVHKHVCARTCARESCRLEPLILPLRLVPLTGAAISSCCPILCACQLTTTCSLKQVLHRSLYITSRHILTTSASTSSSSLSEPTSYQTVRSSTLENAQPIMCSHKEDLFMQSASTQTLSLDSSSNCEDAFPSPSSRQSSTESGSNSLLATLKRIPSSANDSDNRRLSLFCRDVPSDHTTPKNISNSVFVNLKRH